MSEPSSISHFSGLMELLQRIHPYSETEAVLAAKENEVLSPDGETIAKSEQERIRDLTEYLLSLPTPYLTSAQIHDITLSWHDKFGIDGISAALSGGLPQIGLMESALLITAVQEWAETNLDSTALLKETLSQENKNPLALIIQKYVDSNPTTLLTNTDIKEKLASLPLLSALLQMVPSDLLTKAYLLSEQQIVNTMLNHWVESEIKNAEIAREAGQQRDKERDLLRIELLTNLLEKNQTTGVSSAVFSIVIFGCLFAPTSVGIETMGSLVIKTVTTSLGLPQALTAEFQILTQGIMMSAITCAAPSAVSLLQLEGKDPSEKTQSLVATKAYCLSLLRSLEDPTVTSFLQSEIANLVQKGVITLEQAGQTYATLRSTILINAAIALYMKEMGGVTPEEIRALIEGKIDLPEDSLLRALGTFIRIEIEPLSPSQKEKLLTSGLEQLVEDTRTGDIAHSILGVLSPGSTKYNSEAQLSTKG